MITFDFVSYMKEFSNLDNYDSKIEKIKYKLKTEDMTDWYDLNKSITEDVINDILDTSDYIKDNCDVFIIIGTGGSVLGAKGIIDAFKPYFKNNNPEIIFIGTSLSSTYLSDLIDYIKDKEVIINVISKSGTTLETNLYFDYLYKELTKKYESDELNKRIIVTTDDKEGKLRELVNKEGYKSFVLPSNIGGRYSTLTVVGLLPVAVFGLNIYEFIEGAKGLNKDMAFSHAIIRDALYREGKLVESFTAYEPKLLSLLELAKQLFAETQGKENKGILPVASINTADLHSLGQFYQEGAQILFETVININKTKDIYIEKYDKNLDELNMMISNQVAKSHVKNTTYSNFITMNELTPYNIGQLIYFLEISAATGAYLLNLNPFNQPGVNEYKTLVNKELLNENK
ncbi:MAG: glucose-6-phosphate isomerase [Bacilli bacterium]|nr:glucose-6-phosphate isomerase [Bacilli bacterium]MDD4282179.1 glucose-6-phosphate isomerase [Bacilli bacterium]MDD4718542.1 glucose-6-phosphate isomerase [Bacilli bacterium]